MPPMPPPETQRVVPTEEDIRQCITNLHQLAGFIPGCLVVSLIYIERLRRSSGAQMLATTWQPMLLIAVIVAKKARTPSPQRTSTLSCNRCYRCNRCNRPHLNVPQRCHAPPKRSSHVPSWQRHVPPRALLTLRSTLGELVLPPSVLDVASALTDRPRGAHSRTRPLRGNRRLTARVISSVIRSM